MKTPEELNTLKEEVETLNKKLAELSEDELTQVSGGVVSGFGNNHKSEVKDVKLYGEFLLSPTGNEDLVIVPGGVAEPVGQATNCSWQFFD